MITQIFLDVDGPLADFIRGVCELYDMDPARVYLTWPEGESEVSTVLGVKPAEMWDLIHRAGADFWATLRPYPWASDLVRVLDRRGRLTLLTSPSRHPSSSAGKHAWVERYLPSFERRFLIGADKPACARPGAVLIDDSDANCEGFRERGGHAIVFPRPWNSERRNWAKPLTYVLEQLAGLVDEGGAA